MNTKAHDPSAPAAPGGVDVLGPYELAVHLGAAAISQSGGGMDAYALARRVLEVAAPLLRELWREQDQATFLRQLDHLHAEVRRLGGGLVELVAGLHFDPPQPDLDTAEVTGGASVLVFDRERRGGRTGGREASS